MADPTIVQRVAEVWASLTAPGAAFEISQAEIFGSPARIYRHAARNIGEILETAEANFSGHDLVALEDRVLTFAEVFTLGRRFARRLSDELGVRSGDHVGLAMRNRLEWFVAYVALMRLGAVAVLLNSRDGAEQLAHSAQAVECRLIIADTDRAVRLSAGGFTGPLLIVDDDVDAFEAMIGAYGEAEAFVPETDAPAAIFFTSGTTGRSKGAVLTHRNFCNFVMSLKFMGAAAAALATHQGGAGQTRPKVAGPGPSTLVTFPMFHISGVTTFFGALVTGGAIHLMRRWDPRTAIDLIESRRLTGVSGPPLVLSDILDQLDAPKKLSSLSTFAAGGQATLPNLVDRVRATLPWAAQGSSWGMTELSGAVTNARGPVFMTAPDACGPPLPVAEIEARDADGRALGPGEAGELWVRSGLAMRGYWNAPEANAAVFDAQRWLATGDIGFLDPDGFVHVIDRKKDMVISSGENIYCAEVERVLAADHDFVEVAVFGAPDVRLGERVIAAVTLREGASRSEAEVQAFARERLADYKTPAVVVFDLGPFPHNTTGKINKVVLRERYLARVNAEAK